MSGYEVVRTASIDADPARVHDLVDDFREWPAWSPWEGLDPDLERVYSGSDSGIGAHYAWSGNRKAGQGTMEITGSTPDRIDIDLEFRKPWKSSSAIAFELTPTPSGTDVAWRMTGQPAGGVAGLMTKMISMDKLIGKDFERGLTRLKAVAEQH